MSTANNGGSAFPAVEWQTHESGELYERKTEGMTLRDYFAAKAMQTLIAELDGDEDDNPGSPRFSMIEVATLAYEQADAMMEVRK